MWCILTYQVRMAQDTNIHHQHISKFGLPSFTQTSLTAFFIIFLHADGRLFFGASSVRFVRSVLESGEVLGNKIAGTGKMCDGSSAP